MASIEYAGGGASFFKRLEKKARGLELSISHYQVGGSAPVKAGLRRPASWARLWERLVPARVQMLKRW